MRDKTLFSAVVLLAVSASALNAQSITLHKKDAEVWATSVEISGEVDGLSASTGVLRVNEESHPFVITDGRFSAVVELRDRESQIVAEVENAGMLYSSEELRVVRRYDPRPELHAAAEVAGREVTLRVEVVENPLDEAVTFAWSADAENPAELSLSAGTGETVSVSVPQGAPEGEYYFDVIGERSVAEPVRARTLITVTADVVLPFDIRTDHAAWINQAVIYQVTPYNFVSNGRFSHVTAKVPELAELGINTLYLQPHYRTCCPGQGYGVTDYFSIRPDYGTEQDLRALIRTARDHGMRVIFDFVPNHSYIGHRYALDSRAHGTLSHHYDYYQREQDGAPFARHYGETVRDGVTFIRYFWEDLPNLNYDNPEVRRWMTEAGKYWIEHFDIDGYRIDAVWGVNARRPTFMQEWRLALKRIKPEILLLGEDKATWEQTFDERFDVAYDWGPGEGWVSQWNFETQFTSDHNNSHTVFNLANEALRASRMRLALTNGGDGFHPRAKILRHLENNDTPRFIRVHGLDRTKMAAALMFSLHGVPMLYQGQEIGFQNHPYQTHNVFFAQQTIRQRDTQGLFDYYRHLIDMRMRYPALTGNNWAEVPVPPPQRVFAYHRWSGDEHIFPMLNLASSTVEVQVGFPFDDLNLDAGRTYYLTDLLTGDYISGRPEVLTHETLTLSGFEARVFYLGTEPIPVSTGQPLLADVPSELHLAQNYPNPFNPTTAIEFALPRAGRVELAVYDMLGRRVATLVDGDMIAGTHTLHFDASALSSGTYFYRITSAGWMETRQMTVVK